MMQALDTAFFALNSVLLLLEGYSDYKYRGIPLYIVLLHGTLAVAAVISRIVFEGWWLVARTHWVVLLVLLPLMLVYFHTGLIGEGDLIVLVLSGLTSPYVPIGYFAELPAPLPLSLAISSAYPFYRYIKTTSTVYVRGLGKIRARTRYVIDLKRGSLRDEYPIYISGYGKIEPKTAGNPESVKALLESVPDYALVYTVPQYPYVYYYSISFVITYLIITVISILASLVISYVP